MTRRAPPYEKLVLVCVNQRQNGEECCGGKNSVVLVETLKRYVKDHGLKGRVRVSRTGCLGLCRQGPNVAVFPENVWYDAVGETACEEIIQRHLAPLSA